MKLTIDRKLTQYEEATRIDFAARDRRFEELTNATTKKIASEVTAIEKSIVRQVWDLKILDPAVLRRSSIDRAPEYRRIRDVKIGPLPNPQEGPKRIKDVLLNSSVFWYLQGKDHARQEVESSLKRKLDFAVYDVTPTKALEQFKKKIPMTKKEFGGLVSKEKAKAFTVAGIIEKDLLRSVQTLLFRAIEQGWTIYQFERALEANNVKYTGTVYDTEKTGQPISPIHAETIIRTNFAEVYSSGRNSLFNDPDVIGFLPAFQYSAILDSRTRPRHAEMDMRIYLRDDAIWLEWDPPNGFDCRCIKIPVTSNMDYEVSRKVSIRADTGFGGAEEIIPEKPTIKVSDVVVSASERATIGKLTKNVTGEAPGSYNLNIEEDRYKFFDDKKAFMTKELGVKKSVVDSIENDLHSWQGSTNSDGALRLMVTRNLNNNRDPYYGLIAQDVKRLKGNPGIEDVITPEYRKAVNLWQEINFQVLTNEEKESRADPMIGKFWEYPTAFRGIKAEYATQHRMEASGTVAARIRPLSSFTYNSKFAERVAEDGGRVMQKKVKPEDVFDSWRTFPRLRSEMECIIISDRPTINVSYSTYGKVEKLAKIPPLNIASTYTTNELREFSTKNVSKMRSDNVNKLAKELGMTKAKADAVYDEIHDEVKARKKKISINLSDEDLNEVLEAKEFKNMWEAKKRIGTDYALAREQWEANCGITDKHVKYGAVSINKRGGAPAYGGNWLELKDATLKRTYLMRTDSALVDNPAKFKETVIMWDDVDDAMTNTVIESLVKDKRDADEWLKNIGQYMDYPSPSYLEAQIHGKVALKDIEAIHIVDKSENKEAIEKSGKLKKTTLIGWGKFK